jgi:integrase
MVVRRPWLEEVFFSVQQSMQSAEVPDTSFVPPVWLPAARCPTCSKRNDFNFVFCQRCGYQRRVYDCQQPELLQVDELRIEERLKELRVEAVSVPSVLQSNPSFRLFGQFLASREHGRTWAIALPEDVVAFLVFKETAGRTVVHKPDCQFVGSRTNRLCGCETRMALKSLQNVRSALQTAYRLLGADMDWSLATGLGNPVASPLVDRYFKALAKEYADSQVTPSQAVPVLSDKLSVLVVKLLLWSRFGDGPLRTSRAAIQYLQDRCIFAMLMQGGSRCGDILRVRMSAVRRTMREGKNVMILNCFWTKTLRTSANTLFFLVEDTGCRSACPIKAFNEYLVLLRAQFSAEQIRAGFLFPAFGESSDGQDAQMSAQVARRFRKYLESAGLYEGETLHGFRSGAALETLLNGGSEEGAMMKMGWRTRESMLWYTKMDQVATEASPTVRLSLRERNEKSVRFRQWNFMTASRSVI